ncbi:DUF1203 domain-containing protein [Sphingomonas sp.]|uniref:DUF1203 domain-containing protein n=1 Tax=Sphingomonas sp. TaxID=28214 RepID=UPI0025E2D3DD|nr:DUF1203 domain-containing protein [Sphingomonas sp.]
MAYRIKGLEVAQFASFIGASEEELAQQGAIRVVATPRSPCRITLEAAPVGESLILLNHVSHDVATPFRASHAIYVRENAVAAAQFVDRQPPLFDQCTLSLRAFDADAMLIEGVLAAPGEADGRVRSLFAKPETAYIHAHYAAYGCFAAVVERTDD